jgi:hypothetical protein
MAGTLTISTLKNDTGPLATQNGMTGIAKAWVYFSVSGTTPTINGSFNVSSITYNSTGFFTINLTTAMSNANYTALATGSIDINSSLFLIALPYSNSSGAGGYITAPTTTSFTILYTNSFGGSYVNPKLSNVAVFGN